PSWPWGSPPGRSYPPSVEAAVEATPHELERVSRTFELMGLVHVTMLDSCRFVAVVAEIDPASAEEEGEERCRRGLDRRRREGAVFRSGRGDPHPNGISGHLGADRRDPETELVARNLHLTNAADSSCDGGDTSGSLLGLGSRGRRLRRGIEGQDTV